MLTQAGSLYTGKVRINRDLSVEVTGIEMNKCKKSIYANCGIFITHRNGQRLTSLMENTSLASAKQMQPIGQLKCVVKDAMGV